MCPHFKKNRKETFLHYLKAEIKTFSHGIQQRFFMKYRSPTRKMQIFFMIAFCPRALISLTLHDAVMLSIKDTRSWKQ